MGFKDFLFGSADELKQVPTKNKQQMAALQQWLAQLQKGQLAGNNPLYGGGTDFLMNFLKGGPEAFQNFSKPYLEQFNQQVIPGIAERFSGLGSGSQSSSAFQQALGQAGRGLSSDLAQLFSERQFNAAQLAPSYFGAPGAQYSAALGVDPYGYYTKGGQQGFIPGIANSAASGFGQAAGGGFGGWLGKLFGFGK